MWSLAPYFRETKSNKLILPEVTSLSMTEIFDNTMNLLCCNELTLFICLLFLDFLPHLKYCVKQRIYSLFCYMLNFVEIHKKNILKD